MLVGANEEEKEVGIDYYGTPFRGIKGVLKKNPEDFKVTEILSNQTVCGEDTQEEEIPGKPGLFLHFILGKKNADWFSVKQQMCRLLGVKDYEVGFSGTKDKRAITYQLLSVFTENEEETRRKLAKNKNMNWWTFCFARRRRRVALGSHAGNMFEIEIREAEGNKKSIEEIQTWLKSTAIVPNYYGMQRFGVHGSYNHDFARELLNCNFDSLYEKIKCGGNALSRSEKRICKLLKDNSEAVLRSKARSESLVRKILKEEPAVTLMWIHSYKSFLFNTYLSKRMKELGGQAMRKFERIDGEHEVKSLAHTRIPQKYIEFSSLSGRSGEIWREVVEQKGWPNMLDKVKETSNSRSKVVRPLQIELSMEKSTWKEESKCFALKFGLPPGSYATIVLREIMK